MRVRIWGCRGSLAAPGPETVRYGGNTSCVELRPSDGRLLVIDAGTGARNLGVSLGKNRPDRIDILLTHLHLDHIEGLGFFGPVWDPGCEVHIWGPPSPLRSLREDIAKYFSPPLFPVHLDDLPSHLVIHDVPEEEWEIGAVRVRAQPVNHPGPTVGYRIEDEGKVLTYISDHEPALGIDLRTVEPDWISGYALAYGSDVLLHDAQYTEDEYPGRVGWGHSSIAHMVTFALITKTRRLIMFHHDPLHSDAQLEAMLVRAKELWGQDADGVSLSYEGMEIDIS
ncbi:MAG TPA: MBL fold metallo-hydrolase [Actinomycetota bacterium]|nr:MBL fold metallo-hydrolase [Actinomycetota bacterium]